MIKGKIDKNKTIKKQCECERQKKIILHLMVSLLPEISIWLEFQ